MQENRQCSWTVEDLARLRSLRQSYSGKRSGKNCRFHKYLSEQMGRTTEGIAHGVGILNGHRSRSKALGIAKKRRQDAVLPRNLRDTEITYLAAMFEAEGSLTRCSRERLWWRFSFIVNVDRALLDYVHSLVPFASVLSTGDVHDKRKQPCYSVHTASRRGVLWACTLLRPHIRSYKLKKIDEAIAELTPIVGDNLARDLF